MTPPPDRAAALQRGPNIVGLVKRDIGRAVREAAAQTNSPYFGHAALHRDLGPLRERLTLLEQRRPELLAQVADHFNVPRTVHDVATAAQHLADLLLDRRYARPDPAAAAQIATDADTAAGRLRANTAQHFRAPGRSTTPQGSGMQR